MKIDFHTHGKLAKKLPFSIPYTDWMFDQARNQGLDAICLTEHFNTLQFADIYHYLLSKSQREGDCLLLPNGLRVFPGMETDIAEGGHVLCIGSVEDILTLNASLEPYKVPGHFLPFHELRNLFDTYDVKVGAGHPFRDGGHIPELPFEELRRFDFLDLNGKDVALDRQRTENLTYALGKQLHLPVVSGSDTHQAFQYGCIYTELQHSVNTVDDLMVEMTKGEHVIHVSDQAAFQVQCANTLKWALKSIHALGGDYVEVLLQEK